MRDPETLRHPVLPLSRSALRDIVTRILDVADPPGDHSGTFGQPVLEVRITSDRGIMDLHQRHLGGAGPTNVLSFPAESPPTSEPDPNAVRGSIVISADAVLREAFLYGQDPRDHFIRLLTHALLHLADFDHGEIMDDLTEQVVEHLREPTPDNREP
ncbi:rRNA maturation RNase YbeY [Desulfonatronum sp. SC1]|uniref:rRNA maturation RNase YbeY n=1 Tax=Desulfonatronum sp. SC1 TaxID=2109626 RepID=UPI001E382B1E|nr:rRNA maturation RNase YbeY [Desulfonatronum sp. SC1]